MNRDEQRKRHARMVAAIKRGHGVADVADKFNVTNDTIYKVLRAANVKPSRIS